MPWDGSGNYSRSYNWQNDDAANIDILAVRMDGEDDNFATGIGACLTKNNESKPTATFSPNATRTYDLGGSSARWRSAYLGTSINVQSATAAAATTLAFTDATTARTVTFPDLTGTVSLTNAAETISAIKTHTSQVRFSKGADIASANALTLGTDGNYFDITGTTAITSIGTVGVGTVIKLHFDGSLALTHHATDLILPGASNITTAAGDEAEFVEYASGDWRCTSYSRASGSSAVSETGPLTLSNVGITATVSSKALTVAIKNDGLTDPSAGDPVIISFRNSTLTTGGYVVRNVTAATSVVAPSGATLGFVASAIDDIYVYAIDNAGTVEVAISKTRYSDETIVYSTTAIGTGSDSATEIYSTSARTNVAMRLIGKIIITTGAVAGEWDNAPTSITVNDGSKFAVLFTGASTTLSGSGSTITGIPSWATKITIAIGGASSNQSNEVYGIRLGTSGGVETTGYSGGCGNDLTYSAASTYFPVTQPVVNNASLVSGIMTLVNVVDFTWAIGGTISDSTASANYCGGFKGLTGTLDRVTFITTVGSFDSGSWNITYE